MTSPDARVSTPPSQLLPRMDLTNPEAYGYGVRLGDLWCRVAPHPQQQHTIGSRDSLAERQEDNPTNVFENILDIGFAYGRSIQAGGEGLDWFPRQVGETSRRDEISYFKGQNLDVTEGEGDETYQIKLSFPFVNWYSPAGTPTAIAKTQTFFYVAHGTTVEWYSVITGSPSAVGSTDIGTAVIGLAGIGDTMYALISDGTIWSSSAGAAFTSWKSDTGDYKSIWAAKERLVGDYESTPGTGVFEFHEIVVGTDTVIVSYASGVYTTDAIDAGAVVLAATSNGEVYSCGLSSATPPVLEQVSISPMPEGEVALRLAHNAGVTLILTGDEESGGSDLRARLYQTEVLDARFNFILGESQYLRSWQVPDYANCHLGATTRDEIWFLIETLDPSLEMYRFDVTSGGYSQANHLKDVAATGNASDIVVYQDHVIAMFDDDVFVQDFDDFEDDGYLITPNINHGLNTDLNWIAANVEALNLNATGVSITLYRSINPEAILDRNHQSWVQISQLTQQSQSGLEISLTNLTAQQLAMKLEFTKSTGGSPTSPGLTRYAIRSIQAHRDFILDIPINVSDVVEVPGRYPVHMYGWGDEYYKALMDLTGAHIDAVLMDPPFLFRGIVDAVLDPHQYKTERGSIGVRAMVRLRGSKITTEQVSSGTAGIGVGLIGVSSIGVEGTSM